MENMKKMKYMRRQFQFMSFIGLLFPVKKIPLPSNPVNLVNPVKFLRRPRDRRFELVKKVQGR